ncbi:MAG: DUF4399 domain-containing protein [Pseudomonadota bacterium]
MRLHLTIATLILLTGTAQAQDWKKSIKDAAKVQAQGKLESSLGLAKPAPAGAAVYFINLKDGDTVSSPVLVQFGLKNAGVAPAGTQGDTTGHHHVLIDDPQVDMTVALPMTDQVKHFGGGQTETTLTLKPGKHTLQLLFADWKHQSFNPAVVSPKITITVK